MKKKYLLIISFFWIMNVSFAKEVKPDKAKRIAQNMYCQVSNIRDKASVSFKLVYTSKSTEVLDTTNLNLNRDEFPLFYVFNVESNKGFVIVSGDDNTIPILGYSTTGRFDDSDLPPNFSYWLDNYKNQISYIVNHNIQATEEIKQKWDAIERGQFLRETSSSVSPLITARWGQSPYVNDLCPWDYNKKKRCVAGCPATAMAQIMRYWEYPIKGTGSHSYNTNYGNLGVDFSATTYDWASMTDKINKNSTVAAKKAVATLMYSCGVAVEMHYSPSGSGAFMLKSSYHKDARTCENAYPTYFGYDASTIKGLRRANYSDAAWKKILKAELDAGRPIQYAGHGGGFGHTFVFDGYDTNNKFHVNWGWHGHQDGYFTIDGLAPGTGGTGSGAGTYNESQQALIGIQPPSSGIKLYSDIIADPNPVSEGVSFTVHTNLINKGDDTFKGDWKAVLVDQDHNIVKDIETISGASLKANSYYSKGLDFSATVKDFLPGNYFIQILYRPTGGSWKSVGNYKGHSNFKPFTINYPDGSVIDDIRLYADIVADPQSVFEGVSFTVHTSLINKGNDTFKGDWKAVLVDKNYNIVEDIEVISDASLKAHCYYSKGLDFTTSGLKALSGDYFIKILYRSAGKNDWVSVDNYKGHSNSEPFTIRDPVYSDIRLYADVIANPSSVKAGTSFMIHTSFVNKADDLFKGDFKAVLVDKDYNVVENIDVQLDNSLKPHCYYSEGIDFTTPGLKALPGSYFIQILYRSSGGSWKSVADYKDHSNFIPFTINKSDEEVTPIDIRLYANVVADPDPVLVGSPFTVHTSVINKSDDLFKGDFKAVLVDDNHDVVEEIEVISDASLKAHYYYSKGLDFTTSGLKASPGDYYIEILYRSNGSDWESASEYKGHSNFVPFTINKSDADTVSYDIRLYADVIANPNPVSVGASVTVHTDVGNFGDDLFKGDFKAALVNDNHDVIEVIQTISGDTLKPKSHFINGLDFTTSGVKSPIGTYFIEILYLPDGSSDWVSVANNEGYSNFAPFTINKSGADELSDIKLYSAMTVNIGDTIAQNESFKISLSVKNEGNAAFHGDLSVKLFNLEGDLLETIETITDLELNAGQVKDNLDFITKGLNVPAGTYHLILQHLEDGGSWELTDPANYLNPINVTIIESSVELEPDVYEENNTESTAYTLPFSFSDDKASILTVGSNLHIDSDTDYYKINLPKGFKYKVNAKIYDKSHSENGDIYTAEVSCKYKTNDSYSLCDVDIILDDGGTVYFNVSSTETESIGTYLLNVTISRTAESTSVENISLKKILSIYPNPVIENLNIKIDNNIKVMNIEVFDILGKQVLQIDNLSLNNSRFMIPVTNLPKGTYLVLIRAERNIWQQKFVKS